MHAIGHPSDPIRRGGNRRRHAVISMGLLRTRMLGTLAFLATLLAVSAFVAGATDTHVVDLASRPSRFKLAVLATFPRSGTTWTRALFRAAAGLVTGSEVKKMLDSKVPPKAWPASAGRAPPTQLHQVCELVHTDAASRHPMISMIHHIMLPLIEWRVESRVSQCNPTILSLSTPIMPQYDCGHFHSQSD